MATINPVSGKSVDNGREGAELKVVRSGSVPNVVLDTVAACRGGDGTPRQRSCSLSNVNGDSCNCRDLKLFNFHKSTISDCEEPKKHGFTGSERLDFEMQVIASDIQQDSCVQTRSSLLADINEEADSTSLGYNGASRGAILLPTLELPRCPNRMRILAPSKCIECRDCEERDVVLAGQPHEEVTQTEPWCTSWPEDSQTGPSLTAVGPFCRFDYRLRKTKSDKTDVFCSCSWPVDPGEGIVCSRNSELCSYFQQQVSSLDISVTEMVQTVPAEVIDDVCLHILYGSSAPQFPGTFVNKALSPLDYVSLYVSYGRHSEPARCFSMQVSQGDICASRLTQTDPCLMSHACRKSRRFYKDWSCPCVLLPCTFPQQITSVFEVSQQVTATDICDSDETQTCLSLPTRKPFSPAHASPRARRRENKRWLSGRTAAFQIDSFDYCCPATETGGPMDASSQVSQRDMGTTRAAQTCDQIPNLIKCYIRKQTWACKSWC